MYVCTRVAGFNLFNSFFSHLLPNTSRSLYLKYVLLLFLFNFLLSLSVIQYYSIRSQRAHMAKNVWLTPFYLVNYYRANESFLAYSI